MRFIISFQQSQPVVQRVRCRAHITVGSYDYLTLDAVRIGEQARHWCDEEVDERLHRPQEADLVFCTRKSGI